MGGPLQGVRVFDMTHAGVGPWGTYDPGRYGRQRYQDRSPWRRPYS